MDDSTLDKMFEAYLPLLGDEEKRSLLGVIKVFLKLKNANLSFNVEEYNKDIEEAEKRVDAGQYYTHEEVEKMSKEW
jgi:hypothetical protein